MVPYGTISSLFLSLIVGICVLDSWDSGHVQGFYRLNTDHISQEKIETDVYSREVMYYESEGVRIEAWHYTPTIRSTSPAFQSTVVVLGDGLGAQKDFGLPKYSIAYAAEGIASVAFDYRSFGGSDGEPRHLISPSRHVQDWKATIRHVQTLGYTKIILQGTSYAGGHVIVATADSAPGSITAVISQVPFMGGPVGKRKRFARIGVSGTLRTLALFVKDSVHALLGRTPVGARIAGNKDLGEWGLMELSTEDYYLRKAKHPLLKLGGHQNMFLGRGIGDMLTYRPIDYISNFSTPTVITALKDDDLCEYQDIVLAVESCGKNCELLTLNGGHWDIYIGEIFSTVMKKYFDFIKKIVD
mmetsp:Transcript_13319/g.18195  ORF Transcript_13319/g.18195 Transcript_13319/m.18195 type:complete len:357 (+) Transcript_13319:22-1092(+)